MSKESFVVCLSTIDSMAQAKKIARDLLRKRLVACVNLIPKIMSLYHWEGALCEEREILILMKTKSSHIKNLEKVLKSQHPYDVPEFIVLPIKAGSREYLKWLKMAASGLH